MRPDAAVDSPDRTVYTTATATDAGSVATCLTGRGATGSPAPKPAGTASPRGVRGPPATGCVPTSDTIKLVIRYAVSTSTTVISGV